MLSSDDKKKALCSNPSEADKDCAMIDVDPIREVCHDLNKEKRSIRIRNKHTTQRQDARMLVDRTTTTTTTTTLLVSLFLARLCSVDVNVAYVDRRDSSSCIRFGLLVLEWYVDPKEKPFCVFVLSLCKSKFR